jgi:hypothetical protein
MRTLAFAAVLAAAGCSGVGSVRSTAPVRPPDALRRTVPRPPSYPAWTALRLPPVGPGPVPGYVLIADRNNDRVLIVSPQKRVVWRYDGLRGPDDAFFTPGWRSVITNEEFNDTLTEVSLRAKRPIWRYGHDGVAGSSPGYLDTPDDAYRLPDGRTTVADIRNCRIVILSRAKTVQRVIGGGCAHDPPRGFASPNGATPLADGGLLVTEIGGWIDRLDRRGALVWSVRSPIAYPSDAQLLPNGRILVAGFTVPGRIVELTPSGRVTWSFGDASGPNFLAKPSLAVRWPNGLIAANDDYNHRVIVVDPQTKRIVWQYGHTGVASAAAGYLSKPDGLELLPAPQTVRKRRSGEGGHTHMRRRTPSPEGLRVRRIGTLPEPASRLAAVAFPDHRLLVLGGLVGGASSDQVLAGTAADLRVASRLPMPTHDDVGVRLAGGRVYLLGGGQATSSDAVVRIEATGRATRVGSLGEPLSDLGAAVVRDTAYVVGGYTGVKFATGILAFRGGTPHLVARLPVGLRYAGVAALGGRVYIAGGITTAGPSDAIYAFDPRTHVVRPLGTLPAPVAHAPLAALGGALYLVGGDGSSSVVRISPSGDVSIAARRPKPLAGAAAVTVGREIVVLGGDGSDAVYALTPRGTRAAGG